MADCLMKDKRQNKNGNESLDIQIPGLTLGNVGPTVPEEIEQMVSDIPNGSKATSKVVMKQITASDVPVKINRNGAILTHWLNLPFTDGLTTVAAIYKVMAAMADNYQRTHQDAFFEAWPGMLIIDPVNENAELVYNTTWLRVNYKRLCKRAAHYIWHYMNASYLYSGSLANLLIISRANGVSKVKELAYQTRWSKINTETNLFDRFLSVKGRQSWICENSKYALGRTNYGSDLLSIPLWITDIYGNRGSFSLPMDNMITTKGGKGYNSTTISVNSGVNSSKDAEIANKLLLNMYHTIVEYSRDHKVITVNNKKRVWSPMMPPNYNGVTVTVNSQDELAEYSLTDQCNVLNVDDLYITQTGEEHFTGCLWNNYKYWEQYLLDNFSPFMNENSDFYEFVTSQLGLFEKSLTPQDMLNLIRANDNCDMATQLLPRMNYKGKSNVNTATIVKFAPLLKESTIPADNDQGPIVRQDANPFYLNYERYDVDSTDVVSMIAKSKEWPSLTPTVFGGAMLEQKEGNTQPGIPYLPIVLNATPTSGIEGLCPVDGGDTSYENSLVPSVTGKFSTYFDIAATRSLDPENTQVQFHSITSELAKKIVDQDNGITFEEDPTTVRAFMQPLIDNTDPYQCGFNLLIDSDDIVGSELSRFYTNPENFGLKDEDAQFLPSNYKTSYPSISANFISGHENEFLIRHSSIKYYRDRLKRALLFLGSNVFNHPIASYSIDGAAMPKHYAYIYEDQELAHAPDINTQAFATKFKEIDLNEDSTEEDIKWSILFQLFSNGSKVEYNDGDNVTTDSHFELMTEGDKDIITLMFNPMYGPIKPITFNYAELAGAAAIHIFKDTPINVRNNAKSQVVIFDPIGHLGDQERLEKIWQPLYSVFDDAVRRWFYSIRSLTIRPVASDDSDSCNVKLMGEGSSERVMFTCQSDYLASFMNQTIVQFTGMEDTMPFWSNEFVKRVKSVTDSDPIIGKSYLMPEQNLMAEPRVAREMKQSGHRNSVGKKFTRYTSTPTPTSAASEILSDKGSKGNQTSHKARNQKRPFNQDYGTGSNSGVRDQSAFAKSNANAGSIGYDFNKESQSDVLKKTKHDDQQIMQSE